MTKNELRRLKKGIDLIDLLLRDIKSSHSVSPVLQQRNSIYHLFYNNGRIEELFLFLIPIDKLNYMTSFLSTLQYASGTSDTSLISSSGMGRITYQQAVSSLEELQGYLRSALSSHGFSVFYSWQSDLSNSTNRGFIEDALEKALKDMEQEKLLPLKLDKDTAGRAGSPDIAQAILDKIDRCFIFVADVSLTITGSSGKKSPNANVLFELGYAYGVHSDEGVIMVFNTDTGKIEDLPFDIRSKRIITYHCVENMDPEGKKQEKAKLKERLKYAIEQKIKNEVR